MTTISMTGHRPQYFPNEDEFVDRLREDLKSAFTEFEPDLLISGGCYGWDIIGAEVALEVGIPFELYLPFKGFGSNWDEKYKIQLAELIVGCVKMKGVSEDYHKDCFFKRDRAMVDDSDIIFSLLHPDAKRGGTKYTVDYAKKCDKPVFDFWSEEGEQSYIQKYLEGVSL